MRHARYEEVEPPIPVTAREDISPSPEPQALCFLCWTLLPQLYFYSPAVLRFQLHSSEAHKMDESICDHFANDC